MDQPLVSIMIISYNQLDFINETLTSALEQDYENLEIVIADDASTDGTAEVILKYAERFPNRLVPLVGGPNLGITGNSNRALKACKGKYIAFQGGDDVLLPGKITAQVAWMEEDEKRVLCGHQIEVFYEDGSLSHIQRPKLSRGKGPKWVIENGPPFGATAIMVRKDSIPEKGFDERLIFGSDQRLWIDCLGDEGEFGYVNGIYAKYRKHNNNITGKGDIILADIESMLFHLVEEQPSLSAAVNKGLAHQVYIPRARNLIRGGSYVSGIVKLLGLYFLYPQRFLETVYYRISKCKGLHK